MIRSSVVLSLLLGAATITGTGTGVLTASVSPVGCVVCGVDHGTYFRTAENEPWCYDANAAPLDIEVIGVYNHEYRQVEFLRRTKDGWVPARTNSHMILANGTVPAPDCWMKLPPTQLVKKISLCGDFTKRELEEKLKEFDK